MQVLLLIAAWKGQRKKMYSPKMPMKRLGLTIVVALGLCLQGCVIIPSYSVHHAPRGTVEIVDAQTRVPIESALVLVLTVRVQGPLDDIEGNDPCLTDVYTYRPDERIFLHKSAGVYALFAFKASRTQALVLVAPGYAPKYLLAGGSKVRKGDRVTWVLRPVTKAESADILEELRGHLSGKELGRSVLEKWDSGYSWSSEEELPRDGGSTSMHPERSVTIELSDEKRRVAEAYLETAIENMRAK